jgi:pimeloyl-ACP methyl ester carboxylesterase
MRAFWFSGLMALALGFTAIVPGALATEVQTDDLGTLIEWREVPSAHVSPRQVSIWLPPGYDQGTQRYRVVYMQDGQNLFSEHASYGGVEWRVDETLTRLIAEGAIRPAIVVGIWNGGALRSREYVPSKVIDGLSEPFRSEAIAAHGGPPLSDAYLRFVVEELKPAIDAHFRTDPAREATSIMGSSFGGVLSLYALSEHKDVFSAAVAFSTHWPSVPSAQTITNIEAFGAGMIESYARYFASQGPDPMTQRLWTDHGTTELDALYAPFHNALVPVFTASGFVEGKTMIARSYAGTGHNERYWQARFEEAALFLLGGEPGPDYQTDAPELSEREP